MHTSCSAVHEQKLAKLAQDLTDAVCTSCAFMLPQGAQALAEAFAA